MHFQRKNTDLHHRRKGQQKATKEQSALLSRVYKQLLKEKRSGLFHNEQVGSLLCRIIYLGEEEGYIYTYIYIYIYTHVFVYKNAALQRSL